jgi:hypothetical protein
MPPTGLGRCQHSGRLLLRAWVGWLISSRAGSDKLTWVCLAVLSGAGGVVARFAPVGIAFPAIAVLASSMAFDTTAALVVAGIGAAALTGSVLALGTPRAIIVESLLGPRGVARRRQPPPIPQPSRAG